MKKFLNGLEGFFAFIALLLVIMTLIIMASTFDSTSVNDAVSAAKLRIIDSSISGLLAILGMAAQSLFRVSQTDRDLAATARAAAEKVPPITGEAAKNEGIIDAKSIQDHKDSL